MYIYIFIYIYFLRDYFIKNDIINEIQMYDLQVYQLTRQTSTFIHVQYINIYILYFTHQYIIHFLE